MLVHPWVRSGRASSDLKEGGVNNVVVTFQDLPMADREREWDGDAANERFRKWAGADDEPNDKYRKAFVWYEAVEKDLFKSYKLQIADVIDGSLQAVPRGVMAAGNVMYLRRT
ncbi:hypothetical protein BH20ACT21_BH20ACT21_03640 [soil metagenome]